MEEHYWTLKQAGFEKVAYARYSKGTECGPLEAYYNEAKGGYALFLNGRLMATGLNLGTLLVNCGMLMAAVKLKVKVGVMSL